MFPLTEKSHNRDDESNKAAGECSDCQRIKHGDENQSFCCDRLSDHLGMLGGREGGGEVMFLALIRK